MPQPFAPNNNFVSKFLFAGRTRDLEDIFNYLLAGNSVALYGERRGGKTLTLEVIQSIINEKIYDYQDQLADPTLVQALTNWKNKLTNFKAVFISLQGTRKEDELLVRFLEQAKRLGLIPEGQLAKGQNKPLPKTVEGLLGLIQTVLHKNNQRLVILLDEMEVLGDFPKDVGGALAETFANSVAYPNISYVHAGSYQWRERVYSPGSNFTHLEAKYITTISERDIIDVLLQSLPAEDKKSFIADMTGGKPLYAQYLGKAAYEEHPLTENDLLENSAYTSFREQIERNIFKEKGVDESSQRILAALAYHPNVTKRWLAKKLKLNEVDVGNRLNKLTQFGTIHKCEKKSGLPLRVPVWIKKRLRENPGRRSGVPWDDSYVIVGRFIERYGKEICDDPTRKEYGRAPKPLTEHLIPAARWAMMIVMMSLGVGLFLYTHPDSNTRSSPISNVLVTIDFPGSLETDEEGTLHVAVTNANNHTVEAIRLLFDSDSIRFNKSGLSSISFAKIESGETANEEINYRVLSGRSDLLESRVSIPNQNHFSFGINRRKLPLKKYSILLTSILTLLGLLIPGKSWASAFSLLKDLLPVNVSGMKSNSTSDKR
jgi:hypothetical protein